jgi:hypothetical protein
LSKTDKTHPFWVQIIQNTELQRAVHDHRSGVCDLLKPRDRRWWFDHNRCHYSVNYYSKVGRKIFGRCSQAEQSYRAEANGSARTKLRNTMTELRKLIRTDIEDCDFQSFQHKHQALWDVE